MEFICKKIDSIWKTINALKKYEKLYILTLILFAVYIGMSNYFGVNVYTLVFLYLAIFTFTIAIILHIVEAVKMLWGKTYIKWLFGVVLVFISLYTDSVTRIKIYNFVHENPDNYSTAINVLDAIYIYLNFSVFLISIAVLFIFLAPLLTIIGGILANMLNIFPDLSKKIEGLISKSWKISFFLMAATYLTVIYFLVFQKNIFDLETKGVPKMILVSSYYPNTSCKNPELKDKYIKLLGAGDKVSVSNVYTHELVINTPMDVLINLPRLNKNIKFHTTTCNEEK